MTQSKFGFDAANKKTGKEIYPGEMNRVVPWGALVGIFQPHARGTQRALGGPPPFAIETMPRIHCQQLWWSLSDPAMEVDLHERPLYREFARLAGSPRIPDETTILRSRHLLEKHDLAAQLMATINAGLAALMHGEEEVVFADKGYRRIDKDEAKDLEVTWHVAMQPGKRGALNPKNRRDRMLEKIERHKASVRAKVEHPFRVIKQQFQGAVSALGQAHRETDDAVRDEQSVDGAQAADGGLGTSAPAAQEIEAQRLNFDDLEQIFAKGASPNFKSHNDVVDCLGLSLPKPVLQTVPRVIRASTR